MLAAAPCPAQADESSAYITADFWGYARNCIKQHFGEDVKLFPLCRAAGELSPHRLFALDRKAEWGEAAAKRLGQWVGENLISFASRAKQKYACDDMGFYRLQKEITFSVREMTEELYVWACEYLNDKSNYRENGKARDWNVESDARHIKLFTEGNIKEYGAKASVVMLGRTVLFTAPAEIYTEYAKRIIAKFQGYDIIDIQLTHDCIGYLPTEEAIAHGGYSTSYSSALCDGIGGEIYVFEMEKLIAAVIENK